MMSVALREQVRRRAGFRCEYCQVSETDVGGELTIDHFQPQTCGGSDTAENLVYCCHRCNSYKSDYWPTSADQSPLWHPRRDQASDHFLELADGALYPISASGDLTIRRLRLNRAPLIAHRLRLRAETEERQLLMRYQDLITVLERMQRQHADLLQEQQSLLEQHYRVLALLLAQRDR